MITIAKSSLFPSLADVSFADKDPDIITKELVTLYEAASGRTLARADPVRLFLDAVILAIVQQRAIIDNSAKMNLLAYASGEYLDHIGALLGVYRLAAAHAVCTVRFTLGHFYSYNVVIPAGTRLAVSSLTFATTGQLTIPAGSLYADCEAKCSTAGAIGNGYVAGQVNKLADVLAFDVKAENLTETSGGSDIESDEAFRERIQIAPESFSVAGPTKAYEFFARSANPDIIGVAVVGPPDTQPGNVNIYPLMTGGTLPSDEVLGQVLAACNASDVRPDTDYVHVLRPVQVNYNLDLTFWVNEEDSSGAGLIRTNCLAAVNDWETWQRQSLGRDINPSELVHRVIQAGAKRCEVRSPSFTVLREWEVGVCASRQVVYGGLEQG